MADWRVCVCTRRENGALRSSRFVVFWNFRISMSALIPGRNLRFLLGDASEHTHHVSAPNTHTLTYLPTPLYTPEGPLCLRVREGALRCGVTCFRLREDVSRRITLILDTSGTTH